MRGAERGNARLATFVHACKCVRGREERSRWIDRTERRAKGREAAGDLDGTERERERERGRVEEG